MPDKTPLMNGEHFQKIAVGVAVILLAAAALSAFQTTLVVGRMDERQSGMIRSLDEFKTTINKQHDGFEDRIQYLERDNNPH